MRKERMTLKVSSLVQNNGQLGWLPKNPRQWTQTDIDRTAASIREDEDFLEDRPLLVVPKDAKTWVVFAGNLRLTAAKKIGLKEVPCVAYARETDEDDTTIKRRAMKDNGSFGSFDYDLLANEWDDLPLQDWGVPSWKEEEGEPIGPAGSIDIDGLFNPQESKPGGETDIQVVVCIPSDQADKEEDIRAALLITLEQFPGVHLK